MLKRLLSAAVVLFAASAAQAQSNASFQLVSQTETQAVVKVTVAPPEFTAVQTPQGTQYVVSIPHGTPILKKDYPDLEKLSTSLACPDGFQWVISSVVPGAYTDYDKTVAPSKGSVYRNVDITALPYDYAPIYAQDEFFPADFAFLREPYVLRDYAGQALVVNPTRYNPATHTVRHYAELTVTLKAVPYAGALPRTAMPVVTEFKNVYKQHFLNYNHASQARYTPLDEQGSMLIICYDAFMPTMQPFVAWKKQKGISTEMVAVSAIGSTAAAIKTYIQNYYNTHNLAYVILVGDAAQVPASATSNGDSDNDYGYLSGNDSYPEIFVGRFSATTTAELQPQVQKSIDYEKNPSLGAAASWYKRAVCIGSDLGAGQGDDNEADWQHEHNIRAQMLGYTYNDVQELYDGDHSGAGYNDVAGDPTAQNLVDQINQGVSVMNYTGHGDVTLVVTTGFSNTNVPSLTNVGKWPFVWIVGCQTGNFVNHTCFAEIMARATTPAGPTGAVASMMSTINQLWAEPMEAQDEFNAILTDNQAGVVKRTFGGISMNGCMGMNDAYGATGAEMTDTWTCFGDPSLMVRTDVPAALTVTHPATEPVGVNSMAITCNTNGALACLTQNGEILATATVAGGVATFNFNPVTAPDTLVVTVTAYNKAPYIGNVLVIPSEGPYVVVESHAVIDADGNNNGLADYNENVTLSVALKNVGIAGANGVAATLVSNDPNVTITDNAETYGNIASNATVAATSAFALHVANLVADQTAIPLSVNVTDANGNTWNNPMTLVLHAPNLAVASYDVNDASGNNDGTLDPGENVIITLTTANNGSSDATTGQGIFSTSSSDVTIANGTQSGGVIVAAGNGTLSFNVSVHANAVLHSYVPFTYTYDAGGYTATKTFQLKIGKTIETFETNDFGQYPWQLQGTANWFTTTNSPFEGQYCTQSGHVGNHQSSSLSVTVNSLIDDSIRFARRVSSEENYDSLNFYIDGQRLAFWSGALSWQTVAFAVPAGSHTFKWKYAKDGWGIGNDDAAWIDDVDLPLNAIATAIFETETPANDDVNVYPNPAAAQTTVWYAIGAAADVSVEVYNLLGQNVTTLQNAAHQQAGSYTLQLNTSDMAAGQYVVTFRVDGQTYSRKLDVIK